MTTQPHIEITTRHYAEPIKLVFSKINDDEGRFYSAAGEHYTYTINKTNDPEYKDTPWVLYIRHRRLPVIQRVHYGASMTECRGVAEHYEGLNSVFGSETTLPPDVMGITDRRAAAILAWCQNEIKTARAIINDAE